MQFRTLEPPTIPRRRVANRGLATVVVLLMLSPLLWLAPGGAAAQSQNPAPDWFPPYCREQPRINSVYDNRLPLYVEDGQTLLYSGHDVQPCGLGYDGHSGVDYARGPGAQACGGGQRPGMPLHYVFATATGTVRRARWYAPDHETGYGLHVDLTHSDPRHGVLSTLYGHLASVLVEEGDHVWEGQLIGAAGTTGNSSGPHLHFQAARGERGDVSDLSFDPFGWNAAFGPGYRYPGFPQPHRGDAWPMRVLEPGREGEDCPSSCRTEIVDDDDPSVIFGCAAGVGLQACPYWFESSIGGDGGHHWTYPNGATEDYWVRYSCPLCHSGFWAVDAYIPYGASVANAHVARYRAIGSRPDRSDYAVVDQHEEGNIWQPLGMFFFDGVPTIELSDRSDLYDYTDRSPHKIAADALRFRSICFNPDEDPPMTPEPQPRESMR